MDELGDRGQVPTGMYVDSATGLVLPDGVSVASREQAAAAWFLGLLLFIGTLGIGYVTWSLCTWGEGRSPAQRMLGLRCWLPGPGRVAGREEVALRQITGFLLNGQLLCGLFIWLASDDLRSVGDFFARTVLLHDPDGVLLLSPPPPRPREGLSEPAAGEGNQALPVPVAIVNAAHKRQYGRLAPPDAGARPREALRRK